MVSTRIRTVEAPTRRLVPPRGRPRRRPPWLLLLPAGVVLAGVVGYPLVRLALISLQRYDLRTLFTGRSSWVGLHNYADLFGDPRLAGVLLRTVLFCAALVAGTLVIGMLVALMMTRLGRRMRGAVTLSLITAWAMPNVASTLVWQWLFQPIYGIVTWLLSQLRIFGNLSQDDWLSRPLPALAVIWTLVVWQAVPFVALTLYAGLSQIPREFHEAAALDGAGAVWRFRVVTLPFLRPVLLLVAVLSVIWDFNVFNQIWLLTQGGPDGGTTTLGVWSFTTAFSGNDFGKGSAIAVLTTALLMVVTAVYVRRLVRTGEDL